MYSVRSAERGHGRSDMTRQIFCAFLIACLAAAWWNVFLSVFSLELSLMWLYGGLAVLSCLVSVLLFRAGNWMVVLIFSAAGMFLWRNWETIEALFLQESRIDERLAGVTGAVLSVPVIVLWTVVLCSQRGKLIAAAAACAPFVAAACAGRFPSASSSWMFLFAAVMYGVYITSWNLEVPLDYQRKKTVPGRIKSAKRRMFLMFAISAAGFCILAGISVFAGKYLDTGRKTENSFYQTARETLHTEVVDRAERLIYEAEEGSESQEDTRGQEEADIPAQSAQEEVSETQPVVSGSGMDNLKRIASFVPDPEVNEGIIQQEKPAQTVYVPRRIGIAYTGESWTTGEMPDPGDSDTEASRRRKGYTVYPEGLDRLESLCLNWDTETMSAVGSQIDRTLQSMAVYDVNPGMTPEEQDFAEYFLFENHRGFCVHFATTAVLLYRMCGYAAIYTEGYAVPPSAFELQEDGSYHAVIDGSMGHAWCQVYDADNRSWIIRDHTPAARETAPDRNEEKVGEMENAEQSEEESQRNTAAVWVRTAVLTMAAGAVIFVLWRIVLLQASLRRRHFKKKISYHPDGSGTVAVYEAILRTAHLVKKSEEKTDKTAVERLKTDYPEIGGYEWDSLYEQVMQAAFYYPQEREDEWTKTEQLYRRFSRTAKSRVGAGKRFLYRYVYCLDIAPDVRKK